jgi:hypothetical protein
MLWVVFYHETRKEPWMNEKRRAVWLVGVVVLALLLAGLGCSICPLIPQPSPTSTPVSPPLPTEAAPEATSTPEPTPKPETTVEMTPYTDPLAGFSILYPEDWAYEAEANGVFFSESEDALEGSPAEAPMFVTFAGSPEDLEYEFGTTAEPQELLDAVLEGLCGDECEVGESEPWTFGDTPGVGAQVSWRDSSSEVRVQSYIVTAVGDEVAGIGLGAAPEGDWATYEPIFQDMLASLEFFPPEVPEPVERGPIQPGEMVKGTVTLGGRDVWTYEAQEGEYITVWMDAVDSEGLDTYLELYTEDGYDRDELPVVEDDDGGGGTDALIFEFRIDAAGVYHIHALSYSGEGDYQLGLEVADAPSGGGEIGYGETVEATLRGGGEHTWEFSGVEGDEIGIEMRAVEGELDGYLELYSPDDELLVSDDDSGESLDAMIEYVVLPADGVYRIVASDVAGESGMYELTLDIARLEIKGRLTPGQTEVETLDAGARHHWLFEGESGDIVNISLTALDEDLDTYLVLFDPSGEQLTSDDDSGGDSNAAILEFALPRTGDYRVVARGYNEEQKGRYELALEIVELEIQGTLAVDQVASATLEPGERHHWLFEGAAGDIVSISMVAVNGDMDTYLELFAPDGEWVTGDDDSGGNSNAAILEFELPLTGSYRVLARGYSIADTGDYELTLTKQ